MAVRFFVALVVTVLVAGCVTKTEVIRADFTQAEGVYVIGFTEDAEIRQRLEDELVADLRAQGSIAYPSYPDIRDITTSTRGEIIGLVNSKKLISVLLLNQVSADASDSVVAEPERVSPLHPDLQAFYAHARESEPSMPEQGERVFVEINLFVIDGEKANLFWSGTSWSDRADGRGGAIGDISALVTQQLTALRDRLRS